MVAIVIGTQNTTLGVFPTLEGSYSALLNSYLTEAEFHAFKQELSAFINSFYPGKFMRLFISVQMCYTFPFGLPYLGYQIGEEGFCDVNDGGDDYGVNQLCTKAFLGALVGFALGLRLYIHVKSNQRKCHKAAMNGLPLKIVELQQRYPKVVFEFKHTPAFLDQPQDQYIVEITPVSQYGSMSFTLSL
ncbi:hypothetical protein BGZ76_002666 [Entomortierella beljakovae]|nr:hypothetical protein BGZ76_002666 [Entomortierella beljakovae]